MSAPGTLLAIGEAPGRRMSFERLESSRAGRWVISAFLVVILGGIAVTNLPDGAVQHDLAKITQPYMNATGLDQRWNMFSNPRTEILYLEARVEHADGSVAVWHPPTDGPLVGSYRDAHWRKFVEHAVIRPNNSEAWPQLWEPLARFAAAQEDRGSPPVRVTLVKRSAFTSAPDGTRPGRTAFRDEPYYTLRLP